MPRNQRNGHQDLEDSHSVAFARHVKAGQSRHASNGDVIYRGHAAFLPEYLRTRWRMHARQSRALVPGR